jgi:ribosomal protein L7Ae-like RNA K-turn-binding protein
MSVSPQTGPQPEEQALRRRVLDLLGLAARAREVVSGVDPVRRAARQNGVLRVILAEDSAPGQQQKLTPLLEARGVPFHHCFTRDELGAAIGRGAVSAVGITDRNLARRAGELVAALPTVRGTAEPGADLLQD